MIILTLLILNLVINFEKASSASLVLKYKLDFSPPKQEKEGKEGGTTTEMPSTVAENESSLEIEDFISQSCVLSLVGCG